MEDGKERRGGEEESEGWRMEGGRGGKRREMEKERGGGERGGIGRGRRREGRMEGGGTGQRSRAGKGEGIQELFSVYIRPIIIIYYTCIL